MEPPPRVRAAAAMSNDPATRRLLPQNAQMGSFSFAPQQQAYQQPRETQKSARAEPAGSRCRLF